MEPSPVDGSTTIQFLRPQTLEPSWIPFFLLHSLCDPWGSPFGCTFRTHQILIMPYTSTATFLIEAIFYDLRLLPQALNWPLFPLFLIQPIQLRYQWFFENTSSSHYKWTRNNPMLTTQVSIDRWMLNKIWYIHTREYYSALKRKFWHTLQHGWTFKPLC